MSQKKKIFLFVSLLYILYVVFPILQDVSGVQGWIVNLSTFLVLFALYPRAYSNSVVYWFMAYAVVLGIYVLIGKPLTIGIGTVHDSKKVIIEYAYFLPTLSIFSILYYLKNQKLYKIVSLVTLTFLLVSFVYLIPLMLANNFILRESPLDSLGGNKILGMPSYSLMHAYVFLFPAVLYGFKLFNGWLKWAMLLVAVLFVYLIVNTYVTTSLLIASVVIVFSLMFDVKNKTKSYIMILVLFFIIYLLHVLGVFVYIFDFLIEFFDGTPPQAKIEGFKYMYLGGNIESSGDHITGRMNLHDMSWIAFFENIFFGGTSPVGGHSSLLDRLGGMGLLAFVPFIMIIVSQIKIMLRVIRDKEQRVFYFLGLGAVFVMLYEKGLFGQEGLLFMMVLMPGLIIAFRSIEVGSRMKKIKPIRKQKLKANSILDPNVSKNR